MRFRHFGLNRAIEFIEALHHRRFGLRPVHACQSIVLSRLLVKPGIQDLHIFEDLVGRHTGDVIQGEATLRARLPAGLHHQVRFPVFRLRRDLGFKNSGDGGIGLLRCLRSRIGLAHSDEILR
jgi:hypothetical protein